MVAGDTPGYSKGSELPPPRQAELRLYSGRFCPFAHRARLVLNSKKIPHEIININLKEKPEWYAEISPLGKVPLLEESGDKRICESLILAEYVDEKFHDKHPVLLPSTPIGRASQKMLIEVIGSKIIGPHQQTILKGDDESKAALLKALDEIEKLLHDQYFAGNQLGFVDLMIWPWFERLPAVEKLQNLTISPEKYPKLTAWTERMRQDPGVAVTGYPTETYLQFYKTRDMNTGIPA